MQQREIIDLIQSGKTEFFGELYEQYFDEIYKFIFLKTYNTSLSEDITSQTFFKALDKIHTFKNIDGSNFRAWLYRIAYHEIVDNYKKIEHISTDEAPEISYVDDFGKNIDDKEQLKQIFAYFDTLNEKHTQILLMRIWDGLTFKEIAEITGEKLDNCKKIVSRTLSKIPKNIINVFLFIFIIF